MRRMWEGGFAAISSEPKEDVCSILNSDSWNKRVVSILVVLTTGQSFHRLSSRDRVKK